MESPIIAKLPRGHRMDRQFGVVFDKAPAQTDDLTRIDGLGAREATLLNERGIFLFGQVALWRDRETMAIANGLHIPVSKIVDEGWTEQARILCRASAVHSASNLPASALRTVVFLVCALLIGCFTVYLLGGHRNQPLTGVLCADITSIRVPAPSRMTVVHVKAGDEVFSGQPLLTLEKLEHLALIDAEERLVSSLESEQKRLEAQVAIEVEWRTRDVDRELSTLQNEIAQQEQISRSQRNSPAAGASGSGVLASPVSSRSDYETGAGSPYAGGFLYFISASGQSTTIPTRSALQSIPVQTAMAPRENVVSDGAVLASVDTRLEAMQARQLRLETVRTTLPTTISDALGLSNLTVRVVDATQRLEAMKSVSREINVPAPVYGIIGEVRYQEGDDLPAGEVMVRILHTDRRYIVVHLPTRRVNEMQPGHEVELVFPGNEQFRGQVVNVPLLADTTAESGDTLAAVRIEPVGRLWPMVPVGSQVDVISHR